MKKLLAILMAGLLVASFAACGNQKKELRSEATQVTEQATENNDISAVSEEISVENLMNYPESPEEDFKCLEGSEDELVLVDYLGDDEIVVIPESLGITEIGGYVFSNNSPVKAIKLSDSVKKLDYGCFGLNNNLEIFISGDGLKEIGEYAFGSCENLKQVILSDSLTTLESLSFGMCESLMSIELPDSVTKIDTMAFAFCPEGFTIIASKGSYAETFVNDPELNKDGIKFQAK